MSSIAFGPRVGVLIAVTAERPYRAVVVKCKAMMMTSPRRTLMIQSLVVEEIALSQVMLL
jgi:hypothetical protein